MQKWFFHGRWTDAYFSMVRTEGLPEVRNVLVFHAGALGDLVNTLPAFHALRCRFKDASFTAVGNAAFLSLFEAAGVFEKAVSFDRPGMHALFGDGRISTELAGFLSSYELAVTWMRSLRLRERLCEQGLSVPAFSDKFPPPAGSGHVADYMGRPLREIGINEFPEFPALRLPEEIKDNSPRFPGLLIHPGSGSPYKNFPPELLARCGREIARQRGIEIGMTGGPADDVPCGELEKFLGDDLKAVFTGLSTIELAGLLDSAALVLGNDSGVLHLAGALGTPTVALFGPTDPDIWGIKQKNAANLRPSCECAPCSPEIMRNCTDRECLRSLTAEEIMSRGLELSAKEFGIAGT